MAGSAPTDIYGRLPLQFGGAFAADSACINLGLTAGGQSMGGLLVQQFQLQYQQPITRLYSVGSPKTFFVAGRPQGSLNLARVLGPGVVMAGFYQALGNVCNAWQNTLCFCIQSGCFGSTQQTDCNQQTSGAFSAMNIGITNCILQSIGFSIQAQDMIINEQLSLMFIAMAAQDANTGCLTCPGAGLQLCVPCFA